MISFAVDDFAKMAATCDQAPSRVAGALANDMNTSVLAARAAIINEAPFWWPQSRSAAGMMRGVLHVAHFATADDTWVALVPQRYGDKLLLHETGGTITPKSAGSIAIPNPGGPRRTSRGIPADQKPRALQNSFRRGDVIYQRQGKRLKLMYVLKEAPTQPADTHFYDVFAEAMQQEMRVNFASSMIEAVMFGH